MNSDDETKRRALRTMKAIATGFLILAALIYVGARWMQSNGAGEWVGYVRAAAEAGMVGALADWFAVTALFKHPLGIPIPHTAIIRKKKDQLGTQLGSFVGENFLNPGLVSEKVASARIPLRLGQWLQQPGSRERASYEAAKAVRGVLSILRDDDAALVIERTIVRRLAEPQWGPPAGRILAELLEEGRHVPLLDMLADRTHRWVAENPSTIDRWIAEKAPTWAPQFVNELLSERAHRELTEWTWQITANREHPVRVALVEFAEKFAVDLQSDPQTMARLESFKAEVMAHDDVRRAAMATWAAGKKMIVEAAEDESSTLRVKIDELFGRLADSLVSETSLRRRVDDYLLRTASFVAENYSEEITSVISETVQRWDAEEASAKIELQVGRDLQFIRINGTVVGALAGLAIHSLAEVFF